MSAQDFMARNRAQREAAEAKSLAEAVDIIRRQSVELNNAAEYNVQANAKVAQAERQLRLLQPVLHKRLYSPLWNTELQAQRDQPLPNNLWLATSLALLAAGIWWLL